MALNYKNLKSLTSNTSIVQILIGLTSFLEKKIPWLGKQYLMGKHQGRSNLCIFGQVSSLCEGNNVHCEQLWASQGNLKPESDTTDNVLIIEIANDPHFTTDLPVSCSSEIEVGFFSQFS